MSMLRVCAAVTSCVLVAWQGSAHACELTEQPRLEIVADPGDLEPPSTPEVTVARVTRGNDWDDDDEGCGSGSVSSCSGNSFFLLEVRATDDVTAGSSIGYIIDDSIPRLSGTPREPVLADESGRVLVFLDGNDKGESDIDIELNVYAVDKAGNISETPAPVRVRDEGTRGCQLARGAGTGAFFSASMLALLLRRRRTSP